MEPERLARYADKLDHAQRRLGQFANWAGQGYDDELIARLRTWISEID